MTCFFLFIAVSTVAFWCTSHNSFRYFAYKLFVLLFALQSQAHSKYESVKSALLIDVSNSRVLYSKNANMRIPPASLTKLMTLFVIFNKLRSAQVKLTDKVVFSKAAVSQRPSKLYLRVGDHITVRETIYALVTKSANDAAYAVAEKFAGSEPMFAKMMNKYASMLGMKDTHFINASGLHRRDQYSTAKDMAKLALTIFRTFPENFHYFSKKGFFHHGSYLASHNKLLGFSNYEFLVDGMKTGFVNASGYNIVTSAMKGNRRIIVVVMGAHTARERDEMVQKLCRYAFSNKKASSKAKLVSASRKITRKRAKNHRHNAPHDSLLHLVSLCEKKLQSRSY